MLRLGSERSELRVVADQIGAPTSANLLAGTTVEIIRSATDDLPTLLNARGGIVNVTPSGETSWHGFAEAIFASARQRDMPLQIQRVEPIPSSEYPLPATRPLNSRLALETVRDKFGMVMPSWQETLEYVLDSCIPYPNMKPLNEKRWFWIVVAIVVILNAAIWAFLDESVRLKQAGDSDSWYKPSVGLYLHGEFVYPDGSDNATLYRPPAFEGSFAAGLFTLAGRTSPNAIALGQIILL